MNLEQSTLVGALTRIEGIWSPQLENKRDIHIYLPYSYEGSGAQRYPVLYMHDAQNLFDESTSFSGEWQMDEAMQALSAHGVEAIIVGIPNMGEARLDESSPFVAPQKSRGLGQKYLAFIAETVKPLIDASLRTLPDREHTGIVGSSMGGLISLYAFFHRRETFGFAGVMSPSLWFAGRQIFPYVEAAPFVPGRLYLDIGTAEGAAMLADARRMRDLLFAKGYESGQNLLYVEEPGAGHNEAAWAFRVHIALRFLLPREG